MAFMKHNGSDSQNNQEYFAIKPQKSAENDNNKGKNDEMLGNFNSHMSIIK